MSFFGFDATIPKERPPAGGSRGIFEAPDPFAEVAQATARGSHLDDDDDAIHFEDTYDGLADQLDEGNDDFNEDTFGEGAGSQTKPVGKDFDFFGNTAQMANVMGEEQLLYSLQNRSEDQQQQPAVTANQTRPPAGAHPPRPQQQQQPPPPKRTGYEPYQDPGYIPEIQAKSSVWGVDQKAAQAEPSGQVAPTTAAASAKKMMSLEEVEAQMRAQSAKQQQQPPPGLPSQQPHMPTAQALPTLPPGTAGVPPPQAPYGMPQGLPPQGFPHADHPLPPRDGFAPQPLPPTMQDFPPLDQGRYSQSAREGAPPQPPPQQPQGYQRHPQTRTQVPPGLPSSQPQHPKPRGSHGPQPPPQYQQQQQQQQQPSQRPSSQMLGGYSQSPMGPGLAGPAPAAVPPNFMQMTEEQRQAFLAEDAKRAKRNHKIFLLSRGNGLMTPQDKNFITRIQLQQLVAATGNLGGQDSESLLAEDFYYQVFSQIRGAPRQHPRQPLGHFAQTYLFQTSGRAGGHMGRKQYHHADNHMQRMQQQVQRAVEAAKLRPKNKQLIIEGSLGKISFSNANTPKPLLNIKRPESSEGAKPAGIKKSADGTTPSASDRKSILLNIERAYETLMKMENHERTMPPPPDEGDTEAAEHEQEWKAEMKTLNDRLWEDIKVLDPIVPGTTHPFIAFLSFPKGKKVIPRIFRHIDQEQKVTILTMIIVHLDSLDVVRNAQLPAGESQPPVPVREEIDLFSHAVMPSLLGYVNEAPMNVIIGLLGLVIAQTNVEQVSRTRVGLGILTMLLSRAELVKEAGTASDEDWKHWTSLYNRLFDRLEPVLADIFPGTINSGDDMYVWQFLAAVGIGASPEQQQRLVIAVKDRVMETVAQSKTLPADMSSQRLGNVNLFMRAIGLDVELLE